MRWWLAAIAGAVLLAAPKASADEWTARAEALFHEGVREGLLGHYEQSRAAFQESQRLCPRGSTLRNLALTEIKEGWVLEGLGHLKEALGYPDLNGDRRGVADGRRDRRALVQEDIESVYATVGRLAIEADRGARVMLDGADVRGVAPLAEPLDVLPGRHMLDAWLGTRKSHVEVDAPAGALVQVDMRLSDSAGPADSADNPPARAESARSLASGVAAPFDPGKRSAVAPDERSVTASQPYWTTRRYVGLGFVVSGTAAVGASALVGGSASSRAGEIVEISHALGPSGCLGARATNTLCTDLNTAHDRQTAEHLWSVGLLAGGLLAAVTGAAVTLLPDSPTTRASAWTLTPSLQRAGARISFQGAF